MADPHRKLKQFWELAQPSHWILFWSAPLLCILTRFRVLHAPKSWLKHEPLQGIDQHLHVDQLWRVDKNGKNTVVISGFFLDFRHEITETGLNGTKKVENSWKTFWPAFGCAQHPKAGLNTQHSNPYRMQQLSIKTLELKQLRTIECKAFGALCQD